MNKIHDALREEWIGKQFVYTSKYGSETIGEIKDVLIINETRFDKNTENRIKDIVKQKSENKPNSSIVDRVFEGRIPQVRIYSRPLTPSEIKQNFNAFRGRYGL